MFDFKPCWSLGIKGGLELHYVGDVEIGAKVKGFFIVRGKQIDQWADEIYDFWERINPLVNKYNARRLKQGGKLHAIILDGPRGADIDNLMVKSFVQEVRQWFCT